MTERGMSNAERQRRFKAKQLEAGLVQANVWIPPQAVADMQRAAELIRGNPELTIARLVHTGTGRLVGLKAAKS
jgi:hypothetical protein